MPMPASEYELEALPELEAEYEWEGGGGRPQGGMLQRMRRSRGLRRQALMRILGLILRPLPEPALPPPPPPPPAIIRRDQGGQGEFEWEGEWEWEGGEGMNPIRRVYADALMEHLGHAATEAESEAEAEAFIGALIPLAARIIPRAAPVIMRAAPGLIRGLAGATRVLRRSPATRPLVRTMPTIVRRTATSMARQAAQGRPVTPRIARQTLARQTAQVLSSPRQCAQTLQRSQTLDRRYHHAALAPRAGAAGSPRPLATYR